MCLLVHQNICATFRRSLYLPLLLQVLVFGQDPMKVAQPAAHAKKRRKGCGVFNHYADGSGEWVRSVHSIISHCVI